MTSRKENAHHLKEVHVRTPVGQSSDAGFNPDYSMDEDLWNNKVVGIFDKAQSKRFKRGSEPWQQNERAFYQKIWKTILPNVQPMPASPCKYPFNYAVKHI
ncbi:hypothetical protein N0V84_008951 [Fusarium piperis]|uniref:Uncharacterized protein n=1 Tax=Fusarium piperis TaxID=1435070 RepID=A0A9W8W799_9HYPO|nr:hypothetical protein N0V84_008951 [Fusarium piperis]